VSAAAPPPSEPSGSGRVPARGPSPIDNPRVLAGRYRLDSVIGKGSMGTVWAATDQILHRQVAIKEIDFPPGTPAVERAQLEHRTLREARAIAALSNPYVITLFDILTLENGPVIVMELLHARSLAEILRKVGRLPDGQAATIGVAVASGLLAAHAAGITHRDVKPGNVLICDDGRIKLTDFGIARSTAEQTMTATGLLLGSPAYIAPEVANGVPAGPISDAWSLGGLLFATVEGHPPFDQGTAISTLTSVVKDPVPPHPHSGRLGAVVSGLLVKTPRLRMRIDRALAIMRGIADDPSGTNLAAVARIPRDDRPAHPSSSTGASQAGRTQSGGQPPRAATTGGNPRAALHSTARPPATSPADASTHPPAWQPQRVPPAPWSAGRQDPPPTSRSPGPESNVRPQQQVSAQFSRPIVPGPTPQSLPPPPWASADSASLAPLPVAAAEPANRGRIVAAILVAVLAALAGYFGVRIIADLATNNAAPAAAVSVAGS
jgi:eukaryotic-like serine/threonine-protein kinase